MEVEAKLKEMNSQILSLEKEVMIYWILVVLQNSCVDVVFYV